MDEKRALLIIDMQEFFFVENHEVDKQRLGRNCQTVIDTARDNGVLIIHIVTIYRNDRRDWPQIWANHQDAWCCHLVRGLSLTDVVSDIKILKDEIVIEKHRFSAFYGTNLDDILMASGIQHVDIVGYSADVCIRFTSVDAYNRGYGVGIIREGVEAFREKTEASLYYLQWTIDAMIYSMDEYRSACQNDAGRRPLIEGDSLDKNQRV